MNYKIDPIPDIINRANKKIFPLPLRCLIMGTSDCGKTTLLYNIIIIKNVAYISNICTFFPKSLVELHIYQELKKEYEKLSAEGHTEIAYFFNSCEELISVDECEPNSLVVFDDSVNVQQKQIIKITSLEDVIKIFLVFT